jgi:hypothetical protein
MTDADIYRLECLLEELVTRLGWQPHDCDRWAPAIAKVAREYLNK